MPQIEDGGLAELVVRPISRPGLGLAVDLGTTTVVVRVHELATGKILRTARAYNPQRAVAADVLGRVSAAMDGRLADLTSMIRRTLTDCRGELNAQEAVVVGNTTMMHLLVGESPAAYATAPFSAERLFGETVVLDGLRVKLPRCAHAFFGADALAAILASGMCGREGPELFADLGTNGELALWKDGRLTICSVAAGPAFERPGISGSELVAAIADGLDIGAIDSTGLVVGELASGVTQVDVRAVQLAKAALSAGLTRLLAVTNTPLTEIRRLTLAGGLGTALDPAQAARIGLFPRELISVARMVGNLAIEGASAMLIETVLVDEVARLASEARHLELGGDAEFSSTFISSLSFP